MKNLLFPLAYGVGAVCKNKKIICLVQSNGSLLIKYEKHKNIWQTNFIFVRGIIFFIFGLYQTLVGLFDYSNLFKRDGILNKTKNSLNVSASCILYFVTIVISIFIAYLIFGVLPIKLSFYLAPKNYNVFFKRAIIAFLKMVLAFTILLLFKFVNVFGQYYKFNMAVRESQKKNNDVNYLEFFVCVLFCSLLFTSLFGIHGSMWYSVLVNALIFIFLVAFVYELFVLFIRYKWFNALIFPFSFLVLKKASQNEKKCAKIVLNELQILRGNNFKMETEKNMILFSDAYAEITNILTKANKYEKSDVDYIFCEILNKNRAEIKLIKNITKQNYKVAVDVAMKRAKGVPLTKIFGCAYFYGRKFIINDNVLSPRQETEILVMEALKVINKNCRVLDIGTGSGAIAITIAKESGAKVHACDVSDFALDIAQKNAKLLGANVEFIKSDLYKNIKQKFDVIISNPPYIPTKDVLELDEEVKNHDPILALDGGESGLNFYERIINEAPAHLSKNGKIFLEIGIGQEKDVKKLLQKSFKDINIIKDYNKINRVIFATLI